MSKIAPIVASCPKCGHQQDHRIFDSLNADRVPVQVDAILDGSFERAECRECQHGYQPEHTMLFAQYSTRTWIAMHPCADRPSFPIIERGVELILERNFGAAPPMVADGLRGIRPRLVFGQHMLAEAVRCLRSALDPVLLECAKMLALRRNLQQLLDFGPCELAFEAFSEAGDLVHGVHRLETAERIGTFELPKDAIAEVRAGQTELETLYPDLFQRPYDSMCRYFYPTAS